MWYEVPPTAGLPLLVSDLIPSGIELEEQLAAILENRSTRCDTTDCAISGKDIIVTSSATAGLLAALLTLKARSNRKNVIIGGYTCPLVAMAIAQAGLKTILCDLEIDSFDFDLKALERLADSETLCIVPTHLAGVPCEVDGVNRIAKSVGAYVIEDAAQAVGARFEGGDSVGTSGDIGIFSLTRGKGLTIYEGGFLYTKDTSLNQELRTMLTALEQKTRSQHSIEELSKVAQLLGYALLYNPWGLSIVYGVPLKQALRNNDIEKAVGDDLDGVIKANPVSRYRKSIGARSCSRFHSFLASNQARAQRRIEQIKTIGALKIIEPAPSKSGSWPFICVICNSKEQRDRILERLWASGLGVTRLFAWDLNCYDYLRNDIAKFDIPNSSRLAERSFMISNSHWLSDEKFDSIVTVIKQTVYSQVADTSFLVERT